MSGSAMAELRATLGTLRREPGPREPVPGFDRLPALVDGVRRGGCGVQVVMLTTFDDEYLFEAIRAGAAGFLLKDTPPDALRDAVRTVAGGDALLSPAVTRRVPAAAARSPVADPARLAGLTARERDVLAQVGAGRSNAEIGQALFLSPDTARTCVSRLLQKLNARDRAQLVVIAYESGLVRPGEG
ncbi:response regulator transcription factor [Micromonospora sp. WMMD1076]|uniref:LuxR C-terminal-related transcriptional regulator n=1 Tax=Micromonospora sp. WMMD1076 TaxID=3016103 RepID=UPI00249C1E0A|nr:response regulator transcription factor [Micromonospora sp. WMMD1076]WFF08767.1 response regulator transcription factor [Micromonospora sp. WMMD1076]